MAISDKTRKIVWARSGNRCAKCRRALVEGASLADTASVLGEECHIVSGKIQGPRYDARLPVDRLDEPNNLILLCAVHHKIVDEQVATYTVEELLKLKTTHEAWLASALNQEKEASQVRIRRLRENIPAHLLRLTSGRDVLNMVQGACAFSFDHDELHSEAEAHLVADFLQEAQNGGDLYHDLDAGARVKAAFGISSMVEELEQAGFWVFGGREIQRLEGGVGSPSSWPIAILAVRRSTNPSIVKLEGNDTALNK